MTLCGSEDNLYYNDDKITKLDECKNVQYKL